MAAPPSLVLRSSFRCLRRSISRTTRSCPRKSFPSQHYDYGKRPYVAVPPRRVWNQCPSTAPRSYKPQLVHSTRSFSTSEQQTEGSSSNSSSQQQQLPYIQKQENVGIEQDGTNAVEEFPNSIPSHQTSSSPSSHPEDSSSSFPPTYQESFSSNLPDQLPQPISHISIPTIHPSNSEPTDYPIQAGLNIQLIYPGPNDKQFVIPSKLSRRGEPELSPEERVQAIEAGKRAKAAEELWDSFVPDRKMGFSTTCILVVLCLVMHFINEARDRASVGQATVAELEEERLRQDALRRREQRVSAAVGTEGPTSVGPT